MVKIIFPEGADSRIIDAAKILIDTAVCEPVLVGDKKEISLKIGVRGGYSIIEPSGTDSTLNIGSNEVARGEADGVVAGATHTTAEVFRSYVHTIGIRDGVKKITSCFLLEKEDEQYLFTDCGLVPTPDVEVLAESAHLTSEFGTLLGMDPKIAFLSFSTYESAEHVLVKKISDAVLYTKKHWPELIVDGPLQFDSAFSVDVQAHKAPKSVLGGPANIFIFPDLNSGNIGYKIAERMGGYSATGPILLGFKNPALDLSRGCSVEDVVRSAKIACKMVKARKNRA